MQEVSAKIRLVSVTLASAVALMLFSATVSAQSVADNIRPVGQVCLAGQACESTTGGAGPEPAPGAAATEPATAAVSTAVEPPAAVSVEPEPAPAQGPAVAAFDAEASYQMSCFACHGTGAAGAPLPGEQEVWDVIMEKGMAAVMTNVIDGINAMPARGLCATCSDDDLQALVDYMISQ